MAEAYVDQGAYASNLGATPTWGVPQEGDGSATTAAANASIGSILFNAVPTTGAFTICGVTFTSPAGVLDAANVGAAANALAGLINASTTTVAAAVAYGTPQLRNLVYARGPSGGAPAGTCEIMMRVGSTTLNHASNSNVAMSHTFNGTAPTITQFAGGTGGCWGWVLNGSALGVSSSIAALTYGILRAFPMVRTFVPTLADNIIVRTGRNTTVTGACTIAGMSPMRLVFDDGTTWAGDSPTASFTITSSASPYTAVSNSSGKVIFVTCRKLGGLTIKFAYTSTYQNNIYVHANSSTMLFKNVKFVETSHVYTTWGWRLFQQADGYGSGNSCSFVGCEFDFTAVSRSSAIVSPFLMAGSLNNYFHKLQVISCVFRWSMSGNEGVIRGVPLFGGWAYKWNVQVKGNKVYPGAAAKMVAVASGTDFSSGNTIALESNEGLDLAAGAVGLTPTTNEGPESAAIVYDNMVVDGSAKYETRTGFAEVVPGRPTLSATLPNGDYWSWCVFWSTTTFISEVDPYRPPPLRFESRLATGARTIAIEFFIDPAYETQLESGCTLEVMFSNGNGTLYTEQFPLSLSYSAASWANTGSAPYNTYSAFKAQVTTANSVPQNELVSVGLRFDRPATGSSTVVVVNPEPTVT